MQENDEMSQPECDKVSSPSQINKIERTKRRTGPNRIDLGNLTEYLDKQTNAVRAAIFYAMPGIVKKLARDARSKSLPPIDRHRAAKIVLDFVKSETSAGPKPGIKSLPDAVTDALKWLPGQRALPDKVKVTLEESGDAKVE